MQKLPIGLTSPVAIVCNDAGAANNIFGLDPVFQYRRYV